MLSKLVGGNMSEEIASDDKELTRVERKNKTPITVAAEALWGACRFFVWMTREAETTKFEDPEEYFLRELFGKAFDDPETDGDKALEKLGTFVLEGFVVEDDSVPFALLEVMGIIVEFSVQAMKAEKNDDHKLAWSYACDAQYWWGILNAEFSRKGEPSALSINAVRAVRAKLAKDPIQLAKKEIEKHYEENKTQFKRRGFSAQFIREMQVKYPVITDIKTIGRMVAKLNKENELIPR